MGRRTRPSKLVWQEVEVAAPPRGQEAWWRVLVSRGLMVLVGVGLLLGGWKCLSFWLADYDRYAEWEHHQADYQTAVERQERERRDALLASAREGAKQIQADLAAMKARAESDEASKETDREADAPPPPPPPSPSPGKAQEVWAQAAVSHAAEFPPLPELHRPNKAPEVWYVPLYAAALLGVGGVIAIIMACLPVGLMEAFASKLIPDDSPAGSSGGFAGGRSSFDVDPSG